MNTNNQNTPLISVLMPVYNAQKYLRGAIDSILQQSFDNFEFIIVNDGSTDESLSIIKSYNDERIKLINNESNLGLIKSLNKALNVAKGEYLARMDADDVALKNRLQMQIDFFVRHPQTLLLGTGYHVLNGDKVNKGAVQMYTGEELKTILLFATCFAHPTVMFQQKSKEINYSYHPDFVHVEDYQLWTDMALDGELAYLSEPLLIYRHHPQQVSSKHKSEQLKTSSEVRKNYLARLGFECSEEQLNTHNIIGNNQFITSKETLISVEHWMLNLVNQNKSKQIIKPEDFNAIIQKFWVDCCGYTNLGLFAWQQCLNSRLTSLSPFTFSQKLKLFGKCLLRKL